ncbi:MAG: hypothetical protein HFE68_04120 [Erysipelotrichaceae bacterium]|nr:hypothetical protein [Erysipelotrichaceae bacterium]
MNLTSNYYQAEKRYLTPAETDSKVEKQFQEMEEVKSMIRDLENVLDEMYEEGQTDDDMEWQLEELQFRLQELESAMIG